MSSNLHRIQAVRNSKYQASGPKSYVFLMKKYRFTPTLDGPYIVSNIAHQQGKHGEQQTIGGKTTMQNHVLQKKIPPHGTSTSATGAGQVGDVPAQDSQNDSQYLCQVQIGTPAKTFTLDFDTGSADLWVSIRRCPFFPYPILLSLPPALVN